MTDLADPAFLHNIFCSIIAVQKKRKLIPTSAGYSTFTVKINFVYNFLNCFDKQTLRKGIIYQILEKLNRSLPVNKKSREIDPYYHRVINLHG
jgi:hypothetical protein